MADADEISVNAAASLHTKMVCFRLFFFYLKEGLKNGTRGCSWWEKNVFVWESRSTETLQRVPGSLRGGDAHLMSPPRTNRASDSAGG